MQIKYVRSGGFAGLVSQLDFETDTVDPARAAELSRLVQTALPFKASEAIAMDCYNYDVTVKDGEQEYRIQTIDVGVEPQMQAFLSFLDEEVVIQRRKLKEAK